MTISHTQMAKNLSDLIYEQSHEGAIDESILIPRELLTSVVRALEDHDLRVTELIRYNSEQVVKCRVLKAHLDVCVEALVKASSWFREYGRNHRLKGTKESDAKAFTNDVRANLLDNAVTWEIDPSEMGRP